MELQTCIISEKKSTNRSNKGQLENKVSTVYLYWSTWIIFQIFTKFFVRINICFPLPSSIPHYFRKAVLLQSKTKASMKIIGIFLEIKLWKCVVLSNHCLNILCTYQIVKHFEQGQDQKFYCICEVKTITTSN